MPRVSVIVPLYNKAPYVKRALESIASQSLTDFEVVVVDDGSTDGGDEIVRHFPDPRLRFIHQQNAGPAAARNWGLAHAIAPYVAFLDADDGWRPEFLENQASILDAHPEFASASSGWVDLPQGVESGTVWSRRGVTEGIWRTSKETPARIFSSVHTYMHPCCLLVRADIMRSVGGFHEHGCRYAEDAIPLLRLIVNHAVYLHFQPLVELHRDASALSGNYTGARPVEPYLQYPELIRNECPPSLLGLLDRFYAIRACKTACMLSYWGEWRQARELVRRFVSHRDWNTPLFAAALAGSTPLGALLGEVLRTHPRIGKSVFPQSLANK